MCVEVSDEEEEASPSPVGDGPEGARGCGFSYLALSVRVDGGVISMLPEVSPVTSHVLSCH